MHDSDARVPDPDASAEPSTAPAQDVDVEALRAEIAALKAGNAELRDTMLRERAELENQRRRQQRDMDQARRFANEKLLNELLPIYDGLERGLAVETGDVSSVREGISLTLKQRAGADRSARSAAGSGAAPCRQRGGRAGQRGGHRGDRVAEGLRAQRPLAASGAGGRRQGRLTRIQSRAKPHRQSLNRAFRH